LKILMPTLNSNLSSEMFRTKSLVYDTCDFDFTNFIPESESKEYGACSFNLNGISVTSRISKITPTKTGQFVTLWKRNKDGVICPHQLNEATDLYVINCFKENLFGQFVFSKDVLIEKGILSSPQTKGKPGFWVYSTWDVTENKQAQKTQKWQLDYFLENKEGVELDLNRIKTLCSF